MIKKVVLLVIVALITSPSWAMDNEAYLGHLGLIEEMLENGTGGKILANQEQTDSLLLLAKTLPENKVQFELLVELRQRRGNKRIVLYKKNLSSRLKQIISPQIYWSAWKHMGEKAHDFVLDSLNASTSPAERGFILLGLSNGPKLSSEFIEALRRNLHFSYESRQGDMYRLRDQSETDTFAFSVARVIADYKKVSFARTQNSEMTYRMKIIADSRKNFVQLSAGLILVERAQASTADLVQLLNLLANSYEFGELPQVTWEQGNGITLPIQFSVDLIAGAIASSPKMLEAIEPILKMSALLENDEDVDARIALEKYYGETLEIDLVVVKLIESIKSAMVDLYDFDEEDFNLEPHLCELILTPLQATQ